LHFEEQVGRYANNTISFFVEKVEAIFLFDETLLTVLIVDLAFADGRGII
jgi:hypothetical protein